MSPDDHQRRTERLQIIVTDDRGRPLRKPGLARWLKRVAPSRARGGVSVALISDRAMRRLNHAYAGHDYVTDVLSFPNTAAGERAHGGLDRDFVAPPEAARLPRFLGDIVIATGVATRQAEQAGHSFETELRLLALHGLLHLVGYDHAADEGQMARLEGRLRVKGGLRAGLIERAGGTRDRRGDR